MNIKRALGFAVLLWIIIFGVISVLMFAPWFRDSEMRVNIFWYVLAVPIVLLWAKAYFKMDEPTAKKGLFLGLIALVVGTILDAVITVPFFVKDYALFFGDWTMYIGYVEVLFLTIFAGAEFDATYSKPKN